MYESVPQKEHPALPRASHDERARQLFAKDFRKYILLDVPRATRQIWETEVKPGVAARQPGQPRFSRAAMAIAARANGSAKMVWENLTNSPHLRMTLSIRQQARLRAAAPRLASGN